MTVQQIQLRRGTAAAWTSANPTLLSGEMGIETDTRKAKVGDGSTAWTGLSYLADTGFANPMTTALDLMYGGVSGLPTRLAGPSTSGTFALQCIDGVFTWVAVP